MFGALLLFALCCIANGHIVSQKIHADIVIGGGSLAALAAALTSANVSKSLGLDMKIILLEPTDWAGGQLTASNVPPDFGAQNSVPENLPQAFVDLLMASAGPNWGTNPGRCWVSYKCFEAQLAADHINKWLNDFAPNLEVYYNTVIKSSTMDSNHHINSITAIRRTPKAGVIGYETLLSNSLNDWYSTEESDDFTKEILLFEDFQVVIEGTEFADIMMTALPAMNISQGFETPTEKDDTTDSTCGQSTVFPFYIGYDTIKNEQDVTPIGADGGRPFSLDGLSWAQVWSYRRARGYGDTNTVTVKEQSNQNLDNDYPLGYLYLPIASASSSSSTTTTASELIIGNKESSGWQGGINLTTLAATEQRAYGFYQYMKSTASVSIAPYLYLNKTQVNTQHGLSKVPYLRDTRRSKYGLDKFRLLYNDLNAPNPEDNGKTAKHFNDTVGIGVYLYADIHTLKSCSYPSYITCCSHPVLPYYIPFRALTTESSMNLLLAGKVMSQSFLANAATRLHPTEWSSGTAAGAAAALMIANGWTVRDVYNNIQDLQLILTSTHVRSPLTWTW